MRDDLIAGVLLFFGLVFVLLALVLLAGWTETRDILRTGSAAEARVVGCEVRKVNESLGPPYYLVRAVDHQFLQLEFPGPRGETIAVWHDIGAAPDARERESYQVRFRSADPRQYRLAGEGHWSDFRGGVILGACGLACIGVVLWRLISGTSF